MTADPPPDPDPMPPVLDYRTTAPPPDSFPDPSWHHRFDAAFGMGLLAFFLTALLFWLLLFVIWILPPSIRRMLAALALAGAVCWAIHSRRQTGTYGFVVGYLLALGLAVLFFLLVLGPFVL